jgi:protein phosphatase 1 regulatory subunit 37
MIRDYPDVVPSPSSNSNNNTPTSSTTSSPTSSIFNLPLNSPPGTPTLPSPLASTPARAGPILPPPRHPPSGLQTTYTPYVPRSRRQAQTHHQHQSSPPLSASGQPIPIITSSPQGGVTTRHNPTSHFDSITGGMRHDAGPSAALLDKVRALDALPRLGALRTLDLKGNDLRVSLIPFPPGGLGLSLIVENHVLTSFSDSRRASRTSRKC